MARQTPWVIVPAPRPEARLRLYCLPYAGSGAGLYRPWSEQLDERIEVRAISLPGRERRFVEPALTSVKELASLLVAALRPALDPPFAIFGHSLGALIGFETARLLAATGDAPVRLLVSGARAPDQPNVGGDFHRMPDDEFKRGVGRLGGTPPELLAHQDFLEMMLPTLRADFTAAETYHHEVGAGQPFPITAFGGDRDPIVKPANLERWSAHTTAGFRMHVLPGDHFFVTSARAQLLELVRRELAPQLSPL
jgi:surfactin synthase thioesterase subunit